MASKKAAIRRDKEFNGGKGIHVPPFLIASITSECNLHCMGCYSRANNACVDADDVGQLKADEWQRIFLDARDLGVSFILLAGGEPTLRREVIEVAEEIPEIVFPIFTNGTLLDERYYEMFKAHRNLMPVLSIEGMEQNTDERRGDGIFMQLIKDMAALRDHGLFFGASVTVTTKNIEDVTSNEFINELSKRGCMAVIFVEYVPVSEENIDLAPGDEERKYMNERLESLRADHGKCIARGEERDILASKSPMYENGKIIGLVGSFDDVTVEYKQRNEIGRLNRVLDAIPGGIAVYKRRFDEFYSISLNDHLVSMLEPSRYSR